MRRMPTAALIAFVALGGACSEVKIRKVRTPTQYNTWTDDDQRQADSMEGFRFYMQRPFVAVHESFPVHARSFLVDGRVSADGRFVVVEAPKALASSSDPDDLSNVIRTCFRCDEHPTVPVSAISVLKAGGGAAS